MPKQLNTRIIHKHDLEVNWLKAVNFIPLYGELIVYDVEVDDSGKVLALPEGRTTPYTYARFKLGDGTTPVSKLPFAVAQANWEQNDPLAADYIQGRTHYTIKKFNDIIWDGDRTNKDAVETPNNYGWVKVSNQVPTVDDLLGATFTGYNGTAIEITADQLYQESPEVLRCCQPQVVIVSAPTTTESGITYPSAGVYFMWHETLGHVMSLTIYETIHQLDEKYIPDTIARAVDLVQSDWNQTDEAQLDYIKNKPQELSDEEFFNWLNETKVVEPVAANSGKLYTTNDNKIYIL